MYLCCAINTTTESERMKHFLLTLLAALFFLHTNAQSNSIVEGFILYKGFPYFVSMTPDGDIIEFIQTAPEIMPFPRKYTSMEPPMPLGPYVKPPAFALEVYNSPLNSSESSDVVVLDITETKKVFEEETVEVVDAVETKVEMKPNSDKPDMKTTVIRRTNEEAASPIIEKSDSPTAEEDRSYALKFQGFTSRLTPALINQLKDIYKDYQASSSEKITIRSFVTRGDNTNLKLAENRMAACKDLLSTYGVPEDKIETKVEPYRSANSGQINISLD